MAIGGSAVRGLSRIVLAEAYVVVERPSVGPFAGRASGGSAPQILRHDIERGCRLRKTSLAVLAAALPGFVAACGGGGASRNARLWRPGGRPQEAQAQFSSTGGSTTGGCYDWRVSWRLTPVRPSYAIVGTSYVAPLV